MRFKIEGADESTGAERVIELEASDEQQAESIARSQGLLASSVRKADAPMPPPPLPPLPPVGIGYRAPPARPVVVPNYNGLTMGGVILRILGVLTLLLGVLVGFYAIDAVNTAPRNQWVTPIVGGIYALYLIAGGGVTYAMGEACYALRDIARNSWR